MTRPRTGPATVGGVVEPAGVANRVHIKVLELLAAGRNRVVVCVDREARPVCPPGFALAVHNALDGLLRAKGRSADTTTFVVADRAFEAWLLADAQGLFKRGHFKKDPGTTHFEGKIGKREIKDLLGGSYVETRDGPRLFRDLDFPTARGHGTGHGGSRSLDKFLRSLGV